MPRYRKLHVKTTESLDINDMPDDFTRLLWVLLPLGLDREGRGMDNPSWIKAKIMPLREDVTRQQISDAINWYVRRGMVLRYQVDDRNYFWVPNFLKYQGSTIKEADSELPPHPNQIDSNSGVSQELVESNSGTDSDSDSDSDSDADSDADESSAAANKSLEIVKSAYESDIGIVTAGVFAEIKNALREYPPDWIVAAFAESAKNNKRSWAYASAILKRWKTEGYKSARKNGNNHKPVDYTAGLPEHNDQVDDPLPDPEPIGELQRAWSMIAGNLKTEMPRGAWETYVRTIVPIELQDGTVRLQVTPGQKDWLKSRLESTIIRKFAGVFGIDVGIEYVSDQEEAIA